MATHPTRDTTRHRRTTKRILILLVSLFVSGILLPTQTASAHAYLESSSPTDGSILTNAPRQLRLGFSESIVLGATSVEMVDDNGTHYPATNLRLLTSSAGAGQEEPVSLTADLPALPQSAYRLSWQTLSRDDLHRTSGVIVFGIRRQVTAAGTSEPMPRASEAALRWVLFSAIALALGGLLAQRLYRLSGAARVLGRRAAQLSLIGSALGGAAAAVLLADQVSSGGAPLSEILSGRYGAGWLSRELGFVVLAIIAARSVAADGAASRPRAAATGFAVAAATVGTALVGHSGAGGPTRIAADAAHLSAASVWAGGLGCLLLAGITALRRPADRPVVRAALVRFMRPAVISVGVILSTGVYLVSGVAGSTDALLRTFYGQVLLIKVALVGFALFLGLLNHRRLRAAERRPLRQTVVAEALIGLTVFGLAAVITSSQPALEPQFIQAKASSAVPLIDAPAADLQQTLSIRPNLPGRNLIVVDVFNTRRPPPGPIIGVDIALRSSSTKPGPSVAAQPLGDGHWTVPVEIAVGGKTAVQVTVRRLRLPDVTSRFSWTVKEPVIARRAALVSNASISQPLQLAGLILMALVAFGWLAWLGWPHTARGKALRQAGRTPPGALKAGSPAPTSAMGGELELAELIHTGAD